MPGGSEPLLSLKWQPVPGCSEASIYPLLRKADTVSSNSYIVKTPDAVVLVDPGGLPDQAAHLAEVVGAIRDETARPLVVLLTHAHVDHFLAALSVPFMTEPETSIIAIHDRGAAAIRTADPCLTQAEILGQKISPMRIDLCLLAGDGETRVVRTFANTARIAASREPPECGLRRERLVIGDGTTFDIFHTPGHSPDSCCFRIGGLLFIGDILFAASPGIAGLCGWDQEALVRSLAGVRRLLGAARIAVVCPGHGRALAADDADRVLASVENDAGLLGGIAELNPDRARQTAQFAEDCMEQVNELFTVMAGRLFYVSYVMDELGESETAAGLDALIRGDIVDDLLDAFAAFAKEHHAEDRVPIHIALKAGQVIGKLQRSFDQDALAEIIDPTLVQRAERLLGDYTTMLRGFCPPRDCAVQDLPSLLDACIAGHRARSCSDDDVLASTDDDEAFVRMLLGRIGTPPLLADVEVAFDEGTGPLAAPVDRERFLDLVTYLLEDLVGTGAVAIEVAAREDGDTAIVGITGRYRKESPAVGGKARRFLYRLCERAGGTLDVENSEGTRQFVIRIAPGS